MISIWLPTILTSIDPPENGQARPPDATGDGTRPRPVRRRVLKSGMICFNGRHSTLPCVVRDLSGTGAKLASTGSVGVPDTFELHVELDGIWVDCEVQWRRGDLVGVRFTSPMQVTAPTRVQVLNSLTAAAKPSLRRTPKPTPQGG